MAPPTETINNAEPPAQVHFRALLFPGNPPSPSVSGILSHHFGANRQLSTSNFKHSELSMHPTLHHQCAQELLLRASRYTEVNPFHTMELAFEFLHSRCPIHSSHSNTSGAQPSAEYTVDYVKAYHIAERLNQDHVPKHYSLPSTSPDIPRSPISDSPVSTTVLNENSALASMLCEDPLRHASGVYILPLLEVTTVLIQGAMHRPDWLSLLSCQETHWFIISHQLRRPPNGTTHYVLSRFFALGPVQSVLQPATRCSNPPAPSAQEIADGAQGPVWYSFIKAAGKEETLSGIPSTQGPTLVNMQVPAPTAQQFGAGPSGKSSSSLAPSSALNRRSTPSTKGGRRSTPSWTQGNLPARSTAGLGYKPTPSSTPSKVAEFTTYRSEVVDGDSVHNDADHATARLTEVSESRATTRFIHHMNMAQMLGENSPDGPLDADEILAQVGVWLRHNRDNPVRHLTSGHNQNNQNGLVVVQADGTLMVQIGLSFQFDSMANVSMIHGNTVAQLGLTGRITNSTRYLNGAAGHRVPIRGELPSGYLYVMCLPKPPQDPIQASDIDQRGMLPVPIRFIVMDEAHLLDAPLLGTDFLQLCTAGLNYHPPLPDGTPVDPTFTYTDLDNNKHVVPLTYLSPVECRRQGPP